MTRKVTLALISLMLISLFTLSSCSPSNTADPNASAAKSKEPAVTIGFPLFVHRVIEQPATIEAYEETPLVAHISGYVKKVNVDIGSLITGPQLDSKAGVKPGEVLAELSVPERLQELKQKEAIVTQMKAEVAQAAASVDAAEAHILTAKAGVREAESARARADANYDRWKSEYARVEKLVKEVVLDKQIKDETLNQYKAAEANRQEVEAKVQSAKAKAKESEAERDKAKADLEAAKARVLVAAAEEGRVKEMVNYRYIRAPYDGVVTRRNIHTGHYLQPNASGGPGVLFVVARTDKLRIQADIPEADVVYIRNDMEAKIHIPVLKEQSFTAKITRMSWALDAKSRTLRVEIDYLNKDKTLRPGMYANLVFTIDLKDRFTLPSSAIFTHEEQSCCYRVDNGKAVRMPLKLGTRAGQLVEVLQKQTHAPAKAGEPGTWENLTGREEIVLTNLSAVTEGKDVPGRK